MTWTRVHYLVICACLFLFPTIAVACGSTPSPTLIAPTIAPTVPPPSPTVVGTLTPSSLGITFIAQYDPTSNLLTIFGTTPGATIVIGGTPIRPLPTSTPTETPPATNTLAPTPTLTPVFVPPVPTRNLGLIASRETLRDRIMFKTDREGGSFIGGQTGCGGQFTWYVMNSDGGNIQRLENSSAVSLCQAITSRENLSPDGRMIVIADRPFSTGTLYILDTQLNAGLLASGDSPGQGEWVSKLGFRLKSPVWSPASNYIAFVSNHDVPAGQGCVRTTANIFKKQPVQNAQISRLSSFCAGADADHPSFRGDGSQVAFWGGETGKRQIYAVDVGSDDTFDFRFSNQRQLSDNKSNDWDPLWVK